MAKKVSKNSRVGKRVVDNSGSGRDFVKVVKSVKDPITGKYSYKEVMLHKDNVTDFFAKK
ncbi:MAG: hypothetical protein ACI81W_003626 [Saprospiraceae bacterium]|jgi:hypothetical protein